MSNRVIFLLAETVDLLIHSVAGYSTSFIPRLWWNPYIQETGNVV